MSTQNAFDVVVIGAGHNGLTAAATLARKGKSVCVIERSDRVGGMIASHEIAPGLTAPRIAHLLYNMNAEVSRALGFGGAIPFEIKALPTVSLAPDGQHVLIRDGKASFTDGRPHPKAEAFAKLHARLVKFAGVLARLSRKPPPSLSGGLMNPAMLGELTTLARLGLDLKLMGKTEMQEFLRVLLSNIHDLLVDELGDGPLAGAMAADAVRGAYAGPRSPGTVFSLMYRLVNGGTPSLPRGGMAAVAAAFEQAARKAGCDIRCGQGVASLLVEDDAVRGVVLEDGSEIQAQAVLSSVGPMPTLQMAGAQHFDVETVRRIRNLRCKGTVAKVNLVLSKAPAFKGLSEDLHAARLLVAPSSADVERAFNPAKYAEMPTAPTIELVLPGLSEKGASGDDPQLLSAVVNFVPTNPEGGWTDVNRKALIKTVIATLEAYAPGLGDLVTQSEAITPADIEAETGAPGGHWHHAEMGFDQILTVRPINGMARYGFGLGGLYLCGASAHPGGDITGVPGRNCAETLLKNGGI